MRIITFVVCLFSAFPALAEIEARVHYGNYLTKPSSFNKDMQSRYIGTPDVSGPTPMGFDLLYRGKTRPFSVGLRYETYSSKTSGAVTFSGGAMTEEVEFKGTRTSLLAGYHFISRPDKFLSVMASYCASQSMNYNRALTYGPTTNHYEYVADLDSSYGVGLEGGFNLQKVTLGAELGYVSWKAKGFKMSDDTILINSSLQAASMDLSGGYFKVMLGFMFM